MSEDDAYRLIHSCFVDLSEAARLLDVEPTLLHERTGLGETPLHFLAVEDQAAAVRFLHERGAEIDPRNDFGATPFFDALGLGNETTAAYLFHAGANCHCKDHSGETPLHAARQRRPHILLEAGADPERRRLFDETALHVAARYGYVSIIQVLLEFHADANAHEHEGQTPGEVAVKCGFLEAARALGAVRPN